MQRVLRQGIGGFRADIFEVSFLGVPVADGKFKAVQLFDVVFVGDLHDITQHIRGQVGAGDFYFITRDIKIALLLRFFAKCYRQPCQYLLLRRRNRQESAHRQAARVFDVVCVGNRAPVSGTLIILRGDARQRIAVLRDVAVGAIRRGQIQMRELLVQSFVFAQRHASASPVTARLRD